MITEVELTLLVEGLGVLLSDYNDVDEETARPFLARLERLKQRKLRWRD